VRGAVKETETDPITHRKLQLTVVIIIVAFGVLFNVEKTLADLRKEGVAIAEEHIDHLSLGHPWAVQQEG
jgi:hypothetical protein